MALYDCSHLEEVLAWAFTLHMYIADFFIDSSALKYLRGGSMLYHTLFLCGSIKRSSLQSRENGMEVNREMRLELEMRGYAAK